MNDKQRKKAVDALALAYQRVGRLVVAERCGVTVNSTYAWEVCPPRHVLIVQEIAGVPASWLRPDLYPGIEVDNG